MVAAEVIERRPVLAPQPQQVFEALRRHERDAGAATLEQGIRSDGGSVNEKLDRERGLQRVQGVKQADGGIVRRRHDLANLDRPVFREGDEIGESPADVHPHPHHPTSPRPTLVRNAECGMRN